LKKDHYNPKNLPISLLIAKDGYILHKKQPIGRHAAGASFLEAYFRYSGNTFHHIAVNKPENASWFHELAKAVDPNATTHAVPLEQWGNAAQKNGAFHVPDPQINNWAWKRMPWGDAAFSIIGIIHTLCTVDVQEAIGQFHTSPLRHWDALICTSTAGKKAIENLLSRQEEWLKKQKKCTYFERPQMPIIPLGIHHEKWEPHPSKEEAKAKARQLLGVGSDAKVILITGRIDMQTKFQPAPMLRALNDIATTSKHTLELIVYGEAPSPAMLNAWKQGANQLAQNLKIHWIPGQNFSLSADVRWASDIFVSLADNPQETFGITPLEAMAAELPCIVSDWDGYRDTVTQPGDSEEATGFRITTYMFEGLGTQEAHHLLHQTMSYERAVGRISHGIGVDMDEFKKCLTTLLDNPRLCKEMGKAARRRVKAKYSWPIIFEHWHKLTTDLKERRLHSKRESTDTAPQLPPWLSNTSTSFGNYASQILSPDSPPAPPTSAEEIKSIDNPLQSWDRDILNRKDSRRYGWWLKQGLSKYS